jgi:hypothetical protein
MQSRNSYRCVYRSCRSLHAFCFSHVSGAVKRAGASGPGEAVPGTVEAPRLVSSAVNVTRMGHGSRVHGLGGFYIFAVSIYRDRKHK